MRPSQVSAIEFYQNIVIYLLVENTSTILKISEFNETCSSSNIERVLSGKWLDSEVMLNMKIYIMVGIVCAYVYS